ncbi:MAG: hypothetical protein K9G76_05885 [Bacteroidales bacterium]|nr:hypothetical protein [Bacteroidales bacterium]MCF8402442.1 hypothetical protein [Bacteroidales bacterium]
MLSKLQNKWGIESKSRFWLIMFIFAAAGSSTLFVRRPVFAWLGITGHTHWYIVIPAYILTITPSYFIIILLYAAILGQFRFFWKFQMKMFRRFKRTKN